MKKKKNKKKLQIWITKSTTGIRYDLISFKLIINLNTSRALDQYKSKCCTWVWKTLQYLCCFLYQLNLMIYNCTSQNRFECSFVYGILFYRVIQLILKINIFYWTLITGLVYF